MAGERRSRATITEVVDAVILFDGPLLDHRFAALVERHPDEEVRARLRHTPALVAEGARVTRAAAHEWERLAPPPLVDEVVRKAEQHLLKALLDSAEGQVRLKAFLSRHAPDAEVRDRIESAIGIHRDLMTALRDALRGMTGEGAEAETPSLRPADAPYVQAEDEHGDLRGQVERAMRRMREAGHEPRALVVSHVALRHLRDQGCFRGGEAAFDGVPVSVDLAWDAPKFAVHSYDLVALEEILRDMGASPVPASR